MPRGKYVNHKGRSRHFTNPEEMEKELKKELKGEKKKKKDSELDDLDEGEDSSNESASEDDSEEEDSEEDEEEEEQKAKGVESLIEIENPNRAPKKAAQKVNSIQLDEKPGKPELSRREREEIEKQRAQAHYQKLHAEGKTEQARADLARLAIIKERRETERLKREAEKKAKVPEK